MTLLVIYDIYTETMTIIEQTMILLKQNQDNK